MVSRDSLSVFPFRDLKMAVVQIHHKLSELGFVLVEGDDYGVNESEVANAEDREIENPSDVLDEIIRNPTGGWISYSIDGSTFVVSFDGCEDFVTCGLSTSIFKNEYIFFKEIVDSFICQLHMDFCGIRTIQGDDILDRIEVEDEIMKVMNNTFEGEYELDLR